MGDVGAAIRGTAIPCGQCGASLELEAGVRFLKCRFCGTSLEVKESASAVYTEVKELREELKEIAESLGDAKREQEKERARKKKKAARQKRDRELEAFDRAWNAKREGFLVRDKNGGSHEPTKGMAFALWGVGAFGLVGGLMFAQNWPPEHRAKASLIPVFFAVATFVMGIFQYRSSAEFEIAKRRYQRERERLRESLE